MPMPLDVASAFHSMNSRIRQTGRPDCCWARVIAGGRTQRHQYCGVVHAISADMFGRFDALLSTRGRAEAGDLRAVMHLAHRMVNVASAK